MGARVQRASLSEVKLSALALSACYTVFKPVLNLQNSRPIMLKDLQKRGFLVNFVCNFFSIDNEYRDRLKGGPKVA